jgi:hypothetical protein
MYPFLRLGLEILLARHAAPAEAARPWPPEFPG